MEGVEYEDNSLDSNNASTGSNVQFEENSSEFTTNNSNFYQSKDSKMIKLVIKTGLAKNKKQAQIVLFIVSILFITTTIVITSNFLIEKTPEPIDYDDLSEIEKLKLPDVVKNTYINN